MSGHAQPPVHHVILPPDNVLALVDAVTGRLAKDGLLPRPRPAAAVARVFSLAQTGQVGASRAATSVANRLLGYAFSETRGSTASIELRDGIDASGDLIARIVLPASTSTGIIWLGPDGIAVGSLFVVNVSAGTADCTVFLGEV